MSKDYYKILGVDKNASADDVKKAFKKSAMQHHPDRPGGDEAKFKEVNEAYQVLSDAEKRKRYDQFGSDFEQQGGFGGGMNWEDVMRQARGQGGQGFGDFGDLGDIFGSFFGGGQQRSRGPGRGRGIQVDVEIAFKEDALLSGSTMAGLPGISVPMGFVEKLPVGVQFIAPQREEMIVLEAANIYQKNTAWHNMTPYDK